MTKKSERRWSAGLVLISVEPARPLLAKLNGKIGLLDYQQLLSGPDQVHRPYNTSYLTNFMTLPHGVITRLPGIDGPLSLAFSAL